jgi:hypothetical protein
VQKNIGPAWTARGCPPAGYWTKRTAEAWLRRLLVEPAAGTLAGMVRTGATVADACVEYLRYVDHDRQRKPSTIPDYDSIFRNHVLPHLGEIALEDLTAERVERWAATEIDPDRQMANRPREKTITVFHGCMERARKLHRLPFNPVADITCVVHLIAPRCATSTTATARRSPPRCARYTAVNAEQALIELEVEAA